MPSLPGPPPPDSVARPTEKTRFHIDYEWWKTATDDLWMYTISHLPAELREHLSNDPEDEMVDAVSPETAEVRRLSPLDHAFQVAARADDFYGPHVSLVDAVFRVFLVNGNTPTSVRRLAKITGRPAATILKTIGGVQVYCGLRAVPDEA
jgi:hypothetical protein